MTANPTLPIQYGLVGSTPITGSVNSGTLASTRFVTLSEDFIRSPPPAYPDANAGAHVSTSPTASPQTIPSGTRLQLFSDEASALVNAGAANYS
jgi:hypothetical protein